MRYGVHVIEHEREAANIYQTARASFLKPHGCGFSAAFRQ
jgi:hypothetical protein